MSTERHEKSSQITSQIASGAVIDLLITAISAGFPQGSVRYSRRRNMLKNKKIEREERDFILYHTTPHPPA